MGGWVVGGGWFSLAATDTRPPWGPHAQIGAPYVQACAAQYGAASAASTAGFPLHSICSGGSRSGSATSRRPAAVAGTWWNVISHPHTDPFILCCAHPVLPLMPFAHADTTAWPLAPHMTRCCQPKFSDALVTFQGTNHRIRQIVGHWTSGRRGRKASKPSTLLPLHQLLQKHCNAMNSTHTPFSPHPVP